MNENLKLIQQLRLETGLGLAEIKSALDRSKWDAEKAKLLLRSEGKKPLASGIVTGEGVVGYYLHHNNQLGAMVELLCQTDFTARNPEFRELANKIAMHITSANPKYLRREDVPADLVTAERDFCFNQAKASGRPDKLIEDKILPGQMNCFFAQICLLEQGFVADEKVKISDMLDQLSRKVGEGIQIKKFARFQVGG